MVMLSYASVHQSFCPGGPHVVITHDVLDLTVQGPISHLPNHTSDLPLPVTSGGHQQRPVQTCSLQDPSSHHGTDIWWLLKQVWSVSSYWNFFLLVTFSRMFRKLSMWDQTSSQFINTRPLANVASGQVDFQLSCPDGQVESLDKTMVITMNDSTSPNRDIG